METLRARSSPGWPIFSLACISALAPATSWLFKMFRMGWELSWPMLALLAFKDAVGHLCCFQAENEIRRRTVVFYLNQTTWTAENWPLSREPTVAVSQSVIFCKRYFWKCISFNVLALLINWSTFFSSPLLLGTNTPFWDLFLHQLPLFGALIGTNYLFLFGDLD